MKPTDVVCPMVGNFGNDMLVFEDLSTAIVRLWIFKALWDCVV